MRFCSRHSADVGLQEAMVVSVLVSKLVRPYDFQTPVPGQEYAAWILSNDPNQTARERDTIGCLGRNWM